MIREYIDMLRVLWQKLTRFIYGNARQYRATAFPLVKTTKLVIADHAMQTLYANWQHHIDSPSRDDEIGWLLLGVRDNETTIIEAVIQCASPRYTSATNIRFDSDEMIAKVQELRRQDKCLDVLGIVHTHLKSWGHPSEGDWQVDRVWVGRLPGDGVFGIATLLVDDGDGGDHPHRVSQAGIRFSWYTLGKEDEWYRPVPVQVESGVKCVSMFDE